MARGIHRPAWSATDVLQDGFQHGHRIGHTSHGAEHGKERTQYGIIEGESPRVIGQLPHLVAPPITGLFLQGPLRGLDGKERPLRGVDLVPGALLGLRQPWLSRRAGHKQMLL